MEMLHDDKLILRPIIINDLSILNKWKNDETIYKYLGGGFLPTSIDIQKNWLNNLMDMSGNNKRFIIEYDNHPIGMVGLYSINWIHRTCELGLFIGEKDYQGKGLAKNACLLIEQFASRYLNLRKIKLLVVKNNITAIKLYEHLGYSLVGIYKNDRYINGEYCDVCIMEKFMF